MPCPHIAYTDNAKPYNVIHIFSPSFCYDKPVAFK